MVYGGHHPPDEATMPDTLPSVKILFRWNPARVLYEATPPADMADANQAALLGWAIRSALKAHAYLGGAYLRGADLGDVEISILENIDAKILEAVEADGNKLDMGSWHYCETTHCRAGWAIHLCGEAGYALEKAVGSSAAGALIYAKSRPHKPVPNFTASDEAALADLRACAAEAA